MNAPDKIWAWDDGQGGIPRAGDWVDENTEAPECAVEYTRSDLIPQSDPNTRVVTVAQLERWYGKMGSWTCQDEIRAIIGEVK